MSRHIPEAPVAVSMRQLAIGIYCLHKQQECAETLAAIQFPIRSDTQIKSIYGRQDLP